MPETILDRQVARQPQVAFLRVLERHSIDPFPAQGLDEPLGFTVGPGCVGPGSDMLEAQGFAGFGKAPGAVSKAVV